MSAVTELGVLLVDDVEDVRRLLRMALDADPRFRVVGEASDGSQAIDVARRVSPDLVLLDLAMPGMSGMDALPELRKAAPDARVVVVSGTAAVDAEDQVRALGAVGFIEKGLPVGRLVTGLAEIAGALDVVEQARRETRSRLAADVGSAGSARRFVESTLEEWDFGQPLDAVKLLVSELVTNAVVHAGSEPEVVVRLTHTTLRVEVLDHSPVLPVVRQAEPTDVSGRGMALVAQLSSAWGVRPLPGDAGKAVWFEVVRPSGG
ncbi:MAG TPA: response regulator [Acidimicrobiales bacterium]|nr:response regulator [Acidimicrobiales bacterium]